MKVLLRYDWFAPSAPATLPDKRVVSGVFYRRGEHSMPEELRDFLPSSATIIDAKERYEKEVVDHSNTLREIDFARGAVEAEEEIREEAERNRVGRPKASK